MRNSVSAVRSRRARLPPCAPMRTARPVLTGVSKSGCDSGVRSIVARRCGSHTATRPRWLAFARTTRPASAACSACHFSKGVDVALAAPDHHHRRVRAGPPQCPNARPWSNPRNQRRLSFSRSVVEGCSIGPV